MLNTSVSVSLLN